MILFHHIIICVWRHRSVDSPLALLPDAAVVEEEACEGQNWQDTVSPQLLSTLSHREVDRQAVIYGMSSILCWNKQISYQRPVLYSLYFWISFRALHHRGVPPEDFASPGPGLLPEDEVGSELRWAGLHLPKPSPSLRPSWLVSHKNITWDNIRFLSVFV